MRTITASTNASVSDGVRRHSLHQVCSDEDLEPQEDHPAERLAQGAEGDAPVTRADPRAHGDADSDDEPDDHRRDAGELEDDRHRLEEESCMRSWSHDTAADGQAGVQNECMEPVKRPPASVGREAQSAIYRDGVSGRTAAHPGRMAGAGAAARRHLSRAAFAYIAGSAGLERTDTANTEAFRRHRIVPRVLRDVARPRPVDRAVRPQPADPVLPVADRGARSRASGRRRRRRPGRRRAGVPAVLSNQASTPMEVVGARDGRGRPPTTPPRAGSSCTGVPRTSSSRVSCRGRNGPDARPSSSRWTPTCSAGVPATSISAICRSAAAAGSPSTRATRSSSASCRNASTPSARRDARRRPDAAPHRDPRHTDHDRLVRQHPAAPSRAACSTTCAPRFPGRRSRRFSTSSRTRRSPGSGSRFLREHTTPADRAEGRAPSRGRAPRRRARDGRRRRRRTTVAGRSTARSRAWTRFPAWSSAVAGRIPVLFDSGIRSGADAVIALALGATAVGIGRPYAYALAIAGEAGVHELLRNFSPNSTSRWGSPARPRSPS